MDGQIIAVYCLHADMLQALGHRDDRQCHLTDAEVMTIALVAALFFGGNYALTCYFLHEQKYMRRMLSPSRFNRRLHRVKDLFLTLFAFLGEHWKELNQESIYIIDSFPIASCDNIRISRSRRYQGEDYRGYIASKNRYFYGLRLHVVVTAHGEPVEMFLIPGQGSDTGALQWYQFDLPAGSKIIGDKAFNVYAIEDDLASIDIELAPLRKKNSKREIPPWETYLRELHRKYIETAGSMITQRFPKTIHAVTAAGFELKIVLFLLAYSFDCLAR
jgi:Transposase DDE domain